MKKNPTTVPTTVATIFGILLLITGYMWLATQKELEKTLSYNQDDANFQSDKIKTECLASDPESQNNCAHSLQLLSDTISEVQKTRGTGAPASTTPKTAK